MAFGLFGFDLGYIKAVFGRDCSMSGVRDEGGSRSRIQGWAGKSMADGIRLGGFWYDKSHHFYDIGYM